MASQQALSTLISRHECCQYFSVLEKGLNHVIDGIKTVSDLSLSPPPHSAQAASHNTGFTDSFCGKILTSNKLLSDRTGQTNGFYQQKATRLWPPIWLFRGMLIRDWPLLKWFISYLSRPWSAINPPCLYHDFRVKRIYCTTHSIPALIVSTMGHSDWDKFIFQ